MPTLSLEQKVVSLELAKKLKELGVDKHSEFKYVRDGMEIMVYWNEYINDVTPGAEVICSAFLSDELGRMLPHWCYTAKEKDGTHQCWFGDEETPTHIYEEFDGGYIEHDSTEANVRAKMLIYLIENSLIKL